MSRHLRELDSVRGLAALSVVIYHFLLVFPLIFNDTFQQSRFWLVNIFKYSPLRAAFAGYEAVLLFFILSGFVLSLPFYASQPVRYSAFLIRRICRIYIPYLGAVATAVTLDALTSRHGISALSNWLNSTWEDPPAVSLVIQHILLIDSFNSNQYDPVLWSLVQEMRLSLIFPLLMLLVNRYSWRFSLGVGAGIGILGSLIYYVYPSYTTDLFFTLECAGFFIAGALLAKHRLAIKEAYSKLPGWSHYLLFAGALLCYTSPWWLDGVALLHLLPTIGDIIVAIGCATFILLAFSSSQLSKLLLRQPIPFLGKISYSLYLYHVIFLLTALNIMYGSVNIWLILLLAFMMTLAAATLSYVAIEAPAIALGKYLSAKSAQLLPYQLFRIPTQSPRKPPAADAAPMAGALTSQGGTEERLST